MRAIRPLCEHAHTETAHFVGWNLPDEAMLRLKSLLIAEQHHKGRNIQEVDFAIGINIRFRVELTIGD